MYELHPSVASQEDAVRACVEFSAYLRDLARARRAHPGDDLISGLVHVIDEGEQLSEDELVGTCVLLLNAGHEATVNAAPRLASTVPRPGAAGATARRPIAPTEGAIEDSSATRPRFRC